MDDLELRRRYEHPAPVLWTALTTPEGLAPWYGTLTRQGEEVRVVVTGELDAGGELPEPETVRVLDCEAPRHLEVLVPADADGWHLEVTLVADGAATDLTFRQPPLEGVSTADLAAGWTWYLDRLAAALDGRPMPPWEG